VRGGQAALTWTEVYPESTRTSKAERTIGHSEVARGSSVGGVDCWSRVPESFGRVGGELPLELLRHADFQETGRVPVRTPVRTPPSGEFGWRCLRVLRAGEISRTNWIAFHKKVERLWRHGKVHLERYDPRRGAAQYLVKDSAQFPDQGEFIGDPKKVRQRKKKRTRKERDDGR
jgi:hypothetical protein